VALSWTEANAAVTAPGQIFELIDAEVMGVKTQIFKNAPQHLGQVLPALVAMVTKHFWSTKARRGRLQRRWIMSMHLRRFS